MTLQALREAPQDSISWKMQSLPQTIETRLARAAKKGKRLRSHFVFGPFRRDSCTGTLCLDFVFGLCDRMRSDEERPLKSRPVLFSPKGSGFPRRFRLVRPMLALPTGARYSASSSLLGMFWVVRAILGFLVGVLVAGSVYSAALLANSNFVAAS